MFSQRKDWAFVCHLISDKWEILCYVSLNNSGRERLISFLTFFAAAIVSAAVESGDIESVKKMKWFYQSCIDQGMLSFFLSHENGVRGVLCQKQESRAGTSNYIPQMLWDVITGPCPWNLLLINNRFLNCVCTEERVLFLKKHNP